MLCGDNAGFLNVIAGGTYC